MLAPRSPIAQLRNPLHAMSGAVQQLASGLLDAAAAALEFATLSHGINVMIAITSDLLDVEALRLGRLRMSPAPTDIRDVLGAVCAHAAQGVRVLLDVATEVPHTFEVDALRLRQARAAPCCDLNAVSDSS
jgi:signal transduction histidine kinase